MAKAAAPDGKRSPLELIYEESTYFVATKVWEGIIGSAPAKAALDEYCNSDAIVNLVGLIIGITIAQNKPKDKTEELVTRASVNVMLPKEVKMISESIRQSIELYRETLRGTNNQELAKKASFEKFLSVITRFKLEDFILLPVPKATSFIENIGFIAAQRAAVKLVADPVIGVLTAVYQNFTGDDKKDLAKSLIEGFAKGVDASVFNFTEFRKHLSPEKDETMLKVEAKGIGKITHDARPIDTASSTGVKGVDGSGLRRRRGLGIE